MSEHSAAPVSGDHAILARRYVDALFALAEQEDLLDVVVTDLRGLRRVWDESAEWRFIASDPRLSGEAIASATAQTNRLCDLDALTGNFLSVVAQNRRLSLLPAIIETFLDEVAARRGEHRAEVRTAHELSAAQRDTLAASLNAITGGKTHMTVTQDAALLGGLTVKLGSKFIDASVRSRLEQLERTLKGAA